MKKSKKLVHPSFPSVGNPSAAFQGSQSMSPDKQDNYVDANLGIPPIDRGLYQ